MRRIPVTFNDRKNAGLHNPDNSWELKLSTHTLSLGTEKGNHTLLSTPQWFCHSTVFISIFLLFQDFLSKQMDWSFITRISKTNPPTLQWKTPTQSYTLDSLDSLPQNPPLALSTNPRLLYHDSYTILMKSPHWKSRFKPNFQSPGHSNLTFPPLSRHDQSFVMWYLSYHSKQ